MASLGRTNLVFFLVMSALYVSSMAVVYNVGDDTGWTIIGKVDYKMWAASKTFHVGDIVRFVYHPEYHDVMQVIYPDFMSCNTSTPIVTYKTGNDSITIKKGGHYYFICGTPGHCEKGQKVDLQVSPGASAPTDSLPSSDNATSTPSDHKSGASFSSMGLLRKLAAMALFVHASFAYYL